MNYFDDSLPNNYLLILNLIIHIILSINKIDKLFYLNIIINIIIIF